MQLAEVIDGWAAATGHIAYRTYNYNLAECLVPFSKLSVWKHDIPYLKEKGCIGINLESLVNWEIYGPGCRQRCDDGRLLHEVPRSRRGAFHEAILAEH
jgi:hypothetical protein